MLLTEPHPKLSLAKTVLPGFLPSISRKSRKSKWVKNNKKTMMEKMYFCQGNASKQMQVETVLGKLKNLFQLSVSTEGMIALVSCNQCQRMFVIIFYCFIVQWRRESPCCDCLPSWQLMCKFMCKSCSSLVAATL